MKRTILLTAAILCAASIRAQDLYNIKEPPATEILSRPVEAGRIHRTEVVPYDKRHDAYGLLLSVCVWYQYYDE